MKEVFFAIAFLMVGCSKTAVTQQPSQASVEVPKHDFAMIKGVVIDSITGKGIVGSIVAIKRWWPGIGVVSDSIGNYELPQWKSDTHTIIVFHPNYDTVFAQASMVLNETTFVDFLLKPTGIFYEKCGILTGKVTAKETQQPMYGADVFLAEQDIGATTDYNGGYVIYNVPIGTHKVSVRYVGYDGIIDSNVIVYPNRTTIRNFKLSPTEIFRGPIH